jgi:hypothetical protein
MKFFLFHYDKFSKIFGPNPKLVLSTSKNWIQTKSFKILVI